MIRASSVLNCQLISVFRWFRSPTQASISRCIWAKHSSISAMLSRVQRFDSVRVQVVHDQDHPLGLRISPLQHALDGSSASRRRVQRFRPGGAWEQAKATKRASNTPSKMTSRGGRTRRLRSKANSRPCSTNRRFKRSTVRTETPAPRPPGPRSIRARPTRGRTTTGPRVQEPLAGGLGRGPGQCLQFRALFRSERDTIAWCHENPSFRVLQPPTIVYDQLHVMGY